MHSKELRNDRHGNLYTSQLEGRTLLQPWCRPPLGQWPRLPVAAGLAIAFGLLRGKTGLDIDGYGVALSYASGWLPERSAKTGLYAMTAYGAEKFTRDADPNSIRPETRRMQGMSPAAQREGLPRDVSALAWPVW